MRILWTIATISALLTAPGGVAHADAAQDAATHFAAGSKAFDEFDLPKAIEELAASVQAKPTSKALLLLGQAYDKADRIDEARSTYQQFLKIDPRSSKRSTVEGLIRDLEVNVHTKINVISTPPGATVYIGLKAAGPRGKTPTEIRVSPGKLRVMVELEGYEPLAIPNAVAVENQTVAVNANLVVIGCDVEVSAIAPAPPAGSPARPAPSVSIDGGAAVATPVKQRLKLGPHQLEFSGKDLIKKTHSVVCERNRPVKVEETLENIPTGLLALHLPDGAQLTVDGKAAPSGTTLTLSPGGHPVEVTAEGYLPWRGLATVRSGERADFSPPLVPKSADKAAATPIYRRWWLWTIVGAVVAGGAVAAILFLVPNDAPLPPNSAGTAMVTF